MVDVQDIDLGTLVVNAEKSSFSLDCDRLAVTENGFIQLASVVSDATSVKAFGAVLNSKVDAIIFPRDMELSRKANFSRLGPCAIHSNLEALNVWDGLKQRGVGLKRNPNRYKRYFHKMEYGLVHAMFIAREDAFLTSTSPTAIWRALNQSRFTTPILREWLEYLTNEMIMNKMIDYVYGHRCECCLVYGTSAKLDNIVSEGIRQGHLAECFRRGHAAETNGAL